MMPTTTFTGTGSAPAPRTAPWRRALVTGGAGFLGSHLCGRLLDSGVEVDCLDNLRTGRPGNVRHLAGRESFRFLEGDVADPGCPADLPGPYDLVLHLAGPASPRDEETHLLETLDTRSLGTRNALAVADRDGARFLLASSPEDDTRPDRDGHPHALDPLAPRSACAESRRFSEALVAAHAARGSDAGIVRLFHAYGPRMRPDDGLAIPVFVERALAGEPVTVPGNGRQVLSLCYVDDMVDGVLLVAAGRSVRPVDLGGDEQVTVADVARRVVELTGSGSPLAFADGPAADPATGPEHSSGTGPRPATGFARELFGWVPKVGWEEGLARTVAAFTPRPEQAPSERVAVTVTGSAGEWSA
ncbi:NAD-dependent epimerase/dehydratase family protein [Streptomyces sp. DH24]|uniref:NAD-dependent epimerase/dehydratase family protein n=1 Tax=Streptomyces sp. DH24 TaxID=3040123 RepID=UPI002441D14E|nr:NAD-dependent epimerase/dehydratase family protein [Streptomyces sp. DH24]MDG9719882.1 NAD-dependent epimerase/dehydratase family protein [Streptomyces sp. DH24]